MSCLAAGQCLMACLSEERKVLFMELAARFASCRRQPWFATALGELEACSTGAGRYLFPARWIKEIPNRYHIYNGAHMGLGEDRRRRLGREIESTFRMLNIKHLMQMDSPNKYGCKRRLTARLIHDVSPKSLPVIPE